MGPLTFVGLASRWRCARRGAFQASRGRSQSEIGCRARRQHTSPPTAIPPPSAQWSLQCARA